MKKTTEPLKSEDTIREDEQVKKLSNCIKKILKLFRVCKKKKKK